MLSRLASQPTRRRPAAVAIAAAAVMGATPCFAQLRAFGDAEGFGRVATGARAAGSVWHVTNLDDSGPGSFRDAVGTANRFVVFDVAGNINLASEVSVKSNITIAGQTAPGGGIRITGHEVSFGSQSNIIARHIRVSPGDNSGSTENGISLYRSNKVILDHVSIEFANWNNIDAVDDNHTGSQITVQNSLVANPINQQFVAHTESLDGAWTWSNNLLTNSHNRTPLAKVDTIFKNNVIYNYSAGYTVGNTSGVFTHDLINNYFITGPANAAGSNTFYQMNTNQSIYSSGNLRDNNVDGVLNGSTVTPGGVIPLAAPWSPLTADLPTLSPADAYARVVASAGASLTRDQLDALVVSQVQHLGSGTTGYLATDAGPDGGLYHHAYNTGLSNGGLGSIATSSRPAGFDTDKDGIADTWETSHGLNPAVLSDSLLLNPLGYRMIEQYFNELADTDVDRTWSAASGSWSTAASWSGSIVPNAFEHAIVQGNGAANGSVSIASGTATAKTLAIGSNGPAAGEVVSVSGTGKLDIYDSITVGNSNNASLNISGGNVEAYNVILGNTTYSPAPTNFTGTLNLSGGTLRVAQIALGAGTPGNWTAGGSINFSGGTIQSYAQPYINAPINVSGIGGTFNSAGFDGTVAGVISGPAGITKQGAGVMALTAANTYTGTTIIQSGSIAVSALTNAGVPGNLGAASTSAANLVLDGGTLSYTGSASTSTDRLFTLTASSGTLDSGASGQMRFLGTGAVAMSGSGNRTLTLTGTSTTNDFYPSIGDPVSGKTSVVKTGSGRWIFNAPAAPPTYSGDTTILAGTLMTNHADALPSGAGKGNLVVTAGTFEMNGNSQTINGLSGAGIVNQRGSGNRTLTLGSGNASASFAGVLSATPLSTQGTLNLTKIGSGTQTLTGLNTYNGTTTVTAGKLIAGSASAFGTGPLAVNAGATAALTQSLGSAMKLPAITVDNGGTFDVSNNKLATPSAPGSWNGSAYTGLTGLIQSGRGTGNWTGSGIVTSMTAATSSTLTSLGIATANQVTGVAAGSTTTWAGQTVSGTDTLVMYTYAGDANLSGAINGDDYFLIDQGFAAKANGWYSGDFDYNGRINADDYFLIDRNFSRQGAAFAAALPVVGGVSVVPEPAFLALLPIAVLLLAGRRRRSSPEQQGFAQSPDVRA